MTACMKTCSGKLRLVNVDRKFMSIKCKVNVKQSHYRFGVAQRVLRKLRFPDFVTTAEDGGKVVSLSTGRLYPQEMLLVLISVRG